MTGIEAIAEMLRVSTSMNKLNVLSNFIGDAGYEILTKTAEEKGILTLVGFDEGQTEADLSNKRLGPIDAKLIARELTTGFVSTSMNKLNILGNSIGDEGYEMLMKLAEEKGMLTFCGFEEGQTEADLSKKNLGPVDAKLIARELTTGYVSTSMKKIKVNECELPIDVLKTGVEVDLSGQILQVEDAIIIAACVNVNSLMKKLIIFKNNLGDEGIGIITSAVEGKEISLCGAEPGQTDLDLSKQGLGSWDALGPEDAKIIAWELTTGFVSSSMTSVNLAMNPLTYIGSKYDNIEMGIKAIAEALKFSSSMKNAVGRYVYLEIEGVEYRVYFEEAGNTENGIPLLCQHTAGTDGRQYRHILEDKTLHEKYHVVSYDLPFHGRSLPPTEVEYWKKEWKLTKSFFMQVPIQLAKALQLEKPVYMGSSIGGMLAIDLAYHFPNEFRAVIGLEAALATSGRERMDKVPEELRTVEDQHGLMRHPRTGGNSNGIWMYGLTGPDSPEPYRREVAWVYSQGAPDVFAGDIYYYDIDHDLRGKAQEIDTSILDVYLLTGEYDWSATPELTEELAKCIKGCYYQKMDGIGHFPMTENPKQFMKYLSPVLDKIVEKSNVGKMSSTAKSGGGKVAVKSKL